MTGRSPIVRNHSESTASIAALHRNEKGFSRTSKELLRTAADPAIASWTRLVVYYDHLSQRC